ncbi:hypothetical protein LTR36_010612 [Oleoguttula mirabilis]|uniref:BTB domain-containing protein n=1 Tax=Oleoguttula mirabilis TaxID=1507867 RepID=A0AAV9JS75_9PEZI|nr:hypothetical protein LTR36_010612 [Oleoguttula mirabilis]
MAWSTIRRLMSEAPNLATEQLTIIVGTGADSKSFYVHEDLLQAHSDFFAAALHKGWKEAEDRIVRLPTERPVHFGLFAHFVYFGKIYSAQMKPEGEGREARGTRATAELDMLHACWLMGDRLMAVAFKDAVVDTFIQTCTDDRRTPTSMHEAVYAGTAGPNGLRSLLVDYAVWKWKKGAIAEREVDELWVEFFRDFAIRICEVTEEEREGPAPYHQYDCRYHEHAAASKPCYRS